MDARKLRKLLEAEKESYDKDQKRIRSLPADHCCENCGKWVGSSVKRWRRLAAKQLCLLCYDYYTCRTSNWNTLPEQEKIQIVYTVIVNHEKLLKKICRYDDEIYENAVIDRISNFVQNYISERGNILTYIKNAVGWYALKAVALRAKQRMRELNCGSMPLEIVREDFNQYAAADDEYIKRKTEVRHSSTEYLDTLDMDGSTINDASNVTSLAKALHSSYVVDHVPIFELLESLHPFDRWLIENHIINGFSQQALADKAGKSKATINVWISKICEQLKREYEQLQQ